MGRRNRPHGRGQFRSGFRRIIVAAAIGSLTLSGCTAAPPAPQPPAATASLEWADHGPIVFASPGDPTGQLASDIDDWNLSHPDEPVTLHELPESTDQRRDDLVQHAAAPSGEYTVMAVDMAWAQQVAATGGIAALPEPNFPTAGLIRRSVDAATRDGTLYAYPYTVGVGLLYYRKDLLKTAGLQAPQTWSELATACTTILAQHHTMSCYAGQYRQGDDFSANVIEAIQAAGGEAFTAGGTPALDTSAAATGLTWLASGFQTGRMPKAALTFDDYLTRQAFGRGELVFMRDWSDAWSLIGAGEGARIPLSHVGVTELPGRTGVSPSVLNGLSLAISTHGGNLGTARDFVLWLTSQQRQQQRFGVNSAGPAIEKLYTDKTFTATNDLSAVLGKAINQAKLRPVEPDYAGLSKAISDGTYPALSGDRTVSSALADTQKAMEEIVSKR